jgi:hypothetical protein
MPQCSHESKENLQKGVVQRIRKEKLSISLPGSESACALAKKYTNKKYRTHRTQNVNPGPGEEMLNFSSGSVAQKNFFFEPEFMQKL